LEVGIVEGIRKGIDVGGENGRIGMVGNGCERYGDFWPLRFENTCMRMRIVLRLRRKSWRRGWGSRCSG